MKGTRPYSCTAIALTAVLSLSACLSEKGTGETEVFAPFGGEPRQQVKISGSVGDGPVADASISISAADGDSLFKTVSDDNGYFSMEFKAPIKRYPLVLTASGGQDLVTLKSPDLTLQGAVLEVNPSGTANLNPHATLAVAIARNLNGGIRVSTLEEAQHIVSTVMNSGLDKLVADGPLATPIVANNLAETIRASETLAEIFRRSSSALAAAGYEITPDEIVRSLGADLIDGVIEGSGGSQADPLIAATVTVTSAVVLLESMSGELHVDGSLAMQAMQRAISQVAPGSVSPGLMDLKPTKAMINQYRRSIEAVARVSNDPTVTALASGAIPIDETMSMDEVWDALPFAYRSSIEDAVAAVAAGSPGLISAVNESVRSGGDSVGGANRAPSIAGTPAQSVNVGQQYIFQPVASDLDGDPLTFSAEGLPQWLEVDAATGRLSGTPTNADAGGHSGVRIIVSDGMSSNQLGPFSITVVGDDSPLTISGTPSGHALVGQNYRFAPSVDSTGNGELLYSITNKPTWADFSATTGVLSGRPSDSHIGSYSGIRIAVTDGTLVAELPDFDIDVLEEGAEASDISLQWVPPTRNEDGTVLNNLTGYRVYWRTPSGNYSNSMIVTDADAQSVRVRDLAPGTYEFVVTAFNSYGMESRFSLAVQKTAQ